MLDKGIYGCHLRIILVLLFGQMVLTVCENDSITQYGEDHLQTNHTLINLHVNYPQIMAQMYNDLFVDVNYTIKCTDEDTVYSLLIVTEDISVAFIRDKDIVSIPCSPNNTNDVFISDVDSETGEFEVMGNFSFTLGTDLLGRTWLDFILVENISEVVLVNNTHPQEIGSSRLLRLLVIVIRPMRNLDIGFRVIVYIVVISSTIGMGCKTELDVVISVLKKPVAPAIGFFCQYICMPLIAFAIAKLIKFDNPAVSLGIFACGICPGGGISNLYCYILNGDVSLSVTMTTLSTVAALGLIPFWMFTLGSQFDDDKTEINIPYLNIMTTLLLVIVPLFVGMVIKVKCLKVSKVILKIIKPVTFLAIIILLSFGIYVNMFIFRLFSPIHILAGCMLPYFGYIIGGIIALVCRQPWDRVKTIAIETGIQNVGVAFLMLMTSLPPPDGDLAAVGPAASGIMTPLPLFFISIIYVIYNKCRGVTYKPVPTKEKKKPKRNTEINGNNLKNEIILRENVSTV
ncbi:hypothetical protein SNE40_013276 [Patella caerulea]|uniref:Ileal sodium/bile acid cotransporter n=1 Tax=Patella caerulea TaxID=87958 RepID=A0AAN8JLV3_PATCE